MQSSFACPGGGQFEVRPDAQYSQFPEWLEPDPNITDDYAKEITFIDPGLSTNSNVSYGFYQAAKRDKLLIKFLTGKPFQLTIKSGSTFSPVDVDATDGHATIEIGSGTFKTYIGKTLANRGTSYFSRTFKRDEPVELIDVIDPVFFKKDTANQLQTSFLGIRQFPLPESDRIGEYRITIDPHNARHFALVFTRTYSQAPLPPLPPWLEGLSGPDSAMPGATVGVSAIVTDANGDDLAYAWTADGGTISADIHQPGAALWSAPRPSGTYHVGLSVEDAYFKTVSCQTLPIGVENVCPVPAIAQEGGSPLPVEVAPGLPLDLVASGSDANDDGLTWRWEASGGTLSDATGTTTTWTAPAAPGDYSVTAYADDGHGCEAPASRQITVKEVAAGPEITSFEFLGIDPVPADYVSVRYVANPFASDGIPDEHFRLALSLQDPTSIDLIQMLNVKGGVLVGSQVTSNSCCWPIGVFNGGTRVNTQYQVPLPGTYSGAVFLDLFVNSHDFGMTSPFDFYALGHGNEVSVRVDLPGFSLNRRITL